MAFLRAIVYLVFIFLTENILIRTILITLLFIDFLISSTINDLKNLKNEMIKLKFLEIERRRREKVRKCWEEIQQRKKERDMISLITELAEIEKKINERGDKEKWTG